MTKRLNLALIALLLLLTASWASARPYGYPITDPFQATVVGTPEPLRPKLPADIPVAEDSLVVFKDRKVPDYLWYDSRLRYSYVLQDKPAPLIFLIAGTGASHDSAHMLMQQRAFYQAGFHVVSLSSPTYPNFVVAASENSVVGNAEEDAQDLYRVMQQIWKKLQKKHVEATRFFLTGYSLGGFNAAFVAHLDSQKKVFDFSKVLLINPPLRLYSSISLLDRMLENIPGGLDNFPTYFNNILTKFGAVYKKAKRLEFNEEFLAQAFQAMQPKNEELAALIGLSFRFASAHMAFTSDLMTDYGYVKPKNVHLTRNSDPNAPPGRYMNVVFRLGFTDYFHNFFYPYYKKKDPSLTRNKLIEEMSLTAIEDYLRQADNIEVMHNRNDLILEKGEIDFFPRVFGERATIYPVGGHLGNMDYVENVAHMVGVFTEATGGKSL
ncbi:MAG TPA: alpha/beta hydrolase [Gammaproteobacteria bacterium]|nr:alpha/beta hydrolase [Gammaproteobacteria bacterium]